MMEKEAQKYIDLAKACYDDDFEEVKRVIEKHPKLDLDKPIKHSNVKGNGTPLILTGSSKIAKFLISKGADMDVVYDNDGDPITALDSAKKELTKVGTSDEVKVMVQEYIDFLKKNNAKTYEKLQGKK